MFCFGWGKQKESSSGICQCARTPVRKGSPPQGFLSINSIEITISIGATGNWGIGLWEAVTRPNNFVTFFHAVTVDLGLPLPWPRPEAYQPPHADDPILIWGVFSSVGQYALQILSYYGYKNLLATPSAPHHPLLQSLGAKAVLTTKPRGDDKILVPAKALKGSSPFIPFVLDCIGSKSGSLGPIAKIAQSGPKVAVLLPVILKDASDTESPEYSMDVQASADWVDGVVPTGVRTHFYLEVKFSFTTA